MANLTSMTDDELMREMDRAYSAQARCVDNFGSDLDSYRAEQRCKLANEELKRRGLYGYYWKMYDGLDAAA